MTVSPSWLQRAVNFVVLVGYFLFTVTLAHLFIAGSELRGNRYAGQHVLQLLVYFEMLSAAFEQLVQLFVLQAVNFILLVVNFAQLWFSSV